MFYSIGLALGVVYKQIDMLRSNHFTIHSPWKPRLPKQIMLNDDGDPVYRPLELAPYKNGEPVEAKLSVTTANRFGVSQHVHLNLRPRASKALVKASSERAIVHNVFGKSPKTVEQRRTPVALPRAVRTFRSIELTGAEEAGDDDECGIRCRHHHQWRVPAKAKRLSHCLTPVPLSSSRKSFTAPVVNHGPPIRLKGCTFNDDCGTCTDEPHGNLKALQRQARHVEYSRVQ